MCAVIAETDISISNLVYKRKTRLISRRLDSLTIYLAILSLMYVNVSKLFMALSPEEILFCQKRKRQGSHTLPALVLCGEERGRERGKLLLLPNAS